MGGGLNKETPCFCLQCFFRSHLYKKLSMLIMREMKKIRRRQDRKMTKISIGGDHP